MKVFIVWSILFFNLCSAFNTVSKEYSEKTIFTGQIDRGIYFEFYDEAKNEYLAAPSPTITAKETVVYSIDEIPPKTIYVKNTVRGYVYEGILTQQSYKIRDNKITVVYVGKLSLIE